MPLSRTRRNRPRCYTSSEALEQRALLATITVTSNGDAIADDGEITLREAILAANTDESVDGSAAGNGADTIVFDPSLDGQVIQVVNNLPVVRESLTVAGNGRSRTRIRGNRQRRGFAAIGDGIDLHIRNATVFNFKQAVLSTSQDGSLAVQNSRIARNQGGVKSLTDTRIVNSEIVNNLRVGSEDGIGIHVRREISTTGPRVQLEIVGSKIANNSLTDSGDGAGLYAFFADVRISNSAFTGNVATRFGGAIYASASMVEVSSSTIANNESAAGTAGVDATGTKTKITQSTLVDNNPVAVSVASSEFETRNSVYSGNKAPNGANLDIRVPASTLVASHNFISSNLGLGLVANGGVADADGNMIGTDLEPLDPMLFPLQDNGGLTESYLPQPGSPLIDAGAATSAAFDQRGRAFGRVAGSGVDIGAVEFADVLFRVTPIQTVLNESDEPTITIDVQLQQEVASGFDLTVTADAGTAEAGSDFVAVNETLSFTGAAGETRQFNITVLDDDIFETNEAIRFDYAISLANTTIGASPAAVTISSDEASGLSFSKGVIVVGGTEADDVVSLTTSGADIVARLNGDGDDLRVPAADVTAMRAFLFGGDNSLSIEPGLSVDAFVRSGNGADTINTGSGNDHILTRGGDDSISTDAGDDYVHAGAGQDTVESGEGLDTLIGASGNDSLDAGTGADHVMGLHGRDTLLGGNGEDTIEGGGSSDLIDGGEGDDLLYGFALDPNLVPGVDRGDAIRGGAGNDVIRDSFGRNQIDGGDGDDQVVASGTLLGGAGDDTLDAVGSMGDRLRGGEGNDSLDGSTSDDTMFGGSGDDTLSGGDGSDYLEGNGGNDRLNGGDRSDMLLGGPGDDFMLGGLGSDTLLGQAGNDHLSNTHGDNLLDGGAGADSLSGDRGSDILLGGSGPDFLQHNSRSRGILVGGKGADRIFGDLQEDLIISGSTSLDHASLQLVRREWVDTDRSIGVRRQNLIDGTGSAARNNGSVFLRVSGSNPTLFDDTDSDEVDGRPDSCGGCGQIDWFFVNLAVDEVEFEETDLFSDT